jgi:hypothetical protein
MAAFAVCIGVALPVAWRGRRPAAAAHSAVARLDRACLIAGWIVEIRLDGRLCASQPASDLRDRQTLLVAVVAGELSRAAPFGHPVEHRHPKLPEAAQAQRNAARAAGTAGSTASATAAVRGASLAEGPSDSVLGQLCRSILRLVAPAARLRWAELVSVVWKPSRPRAVTHVGPVAQR